MSVFSVSNVSLLYNKKVQALADISFNIEDGDFLAILGPNGSGKSTLLNVISGVLKPSTGKVLLKDADIHSMNRRDVARKIGYVPQNIVVDFPFTCMELVLMGRFPHMSGLGVEKETDRSIARDAMEQTGTLELADRMVHQISGGERQRVFIAQAIAAQPEILMLDEPVSALDIKYRLQIMELLKQLNQEKKMTIITILHDLNLVAGYASKVLFLKKGKLHSFGSPAEILEPDAIRMVFDVNVDVIKYSVYGETFIVPRAMPKTAVTPEKSEP